MAKRGTALDLWADLFDSEYMAHACAAIAGALDGETDRAAMAATIRRHLATPLDAYIIEHRKAHRLTTDVQAALSLRSEAFGLATLLDGGIGPGRDEAQSRLSKLRTAWLEFIACGAGPLVYDGMTKTRTQRKTAARRYRGKAAALSLELLAQRVNAAGGRLSESLSLQLANEFEISERTVQRRHREARTKGLVP